MVKPLVLTIVISQYKTNYNYVKPIVKLKTKIKPRKMVQTVFQTVVIETNGNTESSAKNHHVPL